MKKLLIAVLLLSLCLSLVGCGKYYSSYSAIGSVRSNTSDKAYLSFISFQGRMAFTLRPSERSVIKYETELGEGKVTVSYDIDGSLTELVELLGKEEKIGEGATVEAGVTVHIIVDATDAKNGKITVRLEDAK